MSTGYVMAHRRVQDAHGPASAHPCVDCGEPARDWAYDHCDPDVRHIARGKHPYSLDPAHYQPMCVPCHRALDARQRAHSRQAPKLTGGSTAAATVSVTDLRLGLKACLRLAFDGTPVLITNADIPVAALVSPEDLRKLDQWRAAGRP